MRHKLTMPRVTGGAVELLSVELLEEHARRLAALLSIAPRRGGNARMHLRRLNEHMRALREIYTQLAEDARHEAVSPAAEWLLDNFHVVSAAARDIHHDLPPSFFSRLPRVAADEFAGLPRIYALAIELIGSSAGRIDAQRLQRFISAFQSITPLTIGELWAWPSVLKLALIDYLRDRADLLARGARPSRRRRSVGVGARGRAGRHRRVAGRGASRLRHASPPALPRPGDHRLDPSPPARRDALGTRRDDRGCHPQRRPAFRPPIRPASPT